MFGQKSPIPYHYWVYAESCFICFGETLRIPVGFQLKSAFDVSLLHPSAFSNQLNVKLVPWLMGTDAAPPCSFELVNNEEQRAPHTVLSNLLPISHLEPHMKSNSVFYQAGESSGSTVQKWQMLEWFKWSAPKSHLKGNSESASWENCQHPWRIPCSSSNTIWSPPGKG